MQLDEALFIIESGLQSGAGRARLDAETGSTAEVAALAVLAADSTTEIGVERIALIKRAVADMPLLATGLLALADDSTLDALATALTPA